MTKQAAPAARVVTVKTDGVLQKVTEEQFRADTACILNAADQGIQTVITDANGKTISVAGLNGIRFLPDPSPDPLDELIIALTAKNEPK